MIVMIGSFYPSASLFLVQSARSVLPIKHHAVDLRLEEQIANTSGRHGGRSKTRRIMPRWSLLSGVTIGHFKNLNIVVAPTTIEEKVADEYSPYWNDPHIMVYDRYFKTKLADFTDDFMKGRAFCEDIESASYKGLTFLKVTFWNGEYEDVLFFAITGHLKATCVFSTEHPLVSEDISQLHRGILIEWCKTQAVTLPKRFSKRKPPAYGNYTIPLYYHYDLKRKDFICDGYAYRHIKW